MMTVSLGLFSIFLFTSVSRGAGFLWTTSCKASLDPGLLSGWLWPMGVRKMEVREESERGQGIDSTLHFCFGPTLLSLNLPGTEILSWSPSSMVWFLSHWPRLWFSPGSLGLPSSSSSVHTMAIFWVMSPSGIVPSSSLLLLIPLLLNHLRLILSFFFFNIYSLVLIIWPCFAAKGILVPHQQVKPMAPALEVWSLNHWTTREFSSEVYSLSCWDTAQ